MIQVKINEYNVILEIKAFSSVQNKTSTLFLRQKILKNQSKYLEAILTFGVHTWKLAISA